MPSDAPQPPPTSSSSGADTSAGQEAAHRVASAIKRLRTRRGLTLRALAELSGLTPGFLSMAERGGSSLSLTSLFALAEALEVDPAELLGDSARRPAHAEYTVTRTDDDAPTITSGERGYRVLTARLSEQRLEGLVLTIHPTPEPSPMTRHEGEEFCYLLAGELTFRLPDEHVVLSPGDAMHLKSRMPHGLHNTGTVDARALWVVDHPMLSPCYAG